MDERQYGAILAILDVTVKKLDALLQQTLIQEKFNMALNPKVQQLVDDVAKNRDLAQSALSALAAENTQIADLKTQVANLQAQVAAGQQITADDLAALSGAVDQLEQTNTALSGGGSGGAVTANTTTDPAAGQAATPPATDPAAAPTT